MNIQWQDFLAAQGAHFESAEACGFGDPGAELQAAATGTVLAPLTSFRLIRTSGEEAAGFLHNLLSNDIQHLGRDRALRCGFCNPKGRLLADFLIWRDSQGYLLQLSADIQPAILKKLGMYVLRSKVKLSDAGNELIPIGIAGDEAAAVLQSAELVVPAAAFDVSHVPFVLKPAGGARECDRSCPG